MTSERLCAHAHARVSQPTCACVDPDDVQVQTVVGAQARARQGDLLDAVLAQKLQRLAVHEVVVGAADFQFVALAAFHVHGGFRRAHELKLPVPQVLV